MTNLEKLNEKYIGKKYNQLTVEKVIDIGKRTTGKITYYLETICSCGKRKNITLREIVYGGTKSCGCLQKYHYKKGTPEYKTWDCIKGRCYNKNNHNYKHYGERGIVVCEEWKDDFVAFHIYMGDRPSKKHSIDRVDVNGNYEPGNVRWATSKQQGRNRRNNTVFFYQNKRWCLTEMAEHFNINKQRIQYKIKMGWSHEKIVDYFRQLKPIPKT